MALSHPIKLTSEQAEAISQSVGPAVATDAEHNTYLILRSETFERMKRALEAEEIDRSLFECEEESPRP